MTKKVYASETKPSKKAGNSAYRWKGMTISPFGKVVMAPNWAPGQYEKVFGKPDPSQR